MKRANARAAVEAGVFLLTLTGALMMSAFGCSGRVAGDTPPSSVASGEASDGSVAPVVAASDGSVAPAVAASDGSACASRAGAIGATIDSPGPSPSTCFTTGRVICTLPTGVTPPSLFPTDGGLPDPPQHQTIAGLSSVPVTVGTGTGLPPAPVGGAVAPGDYQLVAASVYGSIPPNVAGPLSPGEVLGANLNVSCDTFNVVFGTVASDGGLGEFGGNGCGRLVPFAIPLPALAGLADAGDVWGDWMPYSASPGRLTLIDTEAYEDFGLGLTEGSYTIVEEFASTDGSTSASAAAVAPNASGCTSPPPAPAARDPRCPASPPENSETCDPNPDPLECEYGGDALGRCTTLAICALQTDGTYRFVVVPSANEPGCTDAAGCPSTYAAAAAIDAGTGLCGPVSLACDYPEGTCSSAFDGTAINWACTSRAAVGNCPATRPLSGDACPTAGLQCYYGDPCGGVYEGLPLTCSVGGYWETFLAEYSCPARLLPVCADAGTP